VENRSPLYRQWSIPSSFGSEREIIDQIAAEIRRREPDDSRTEDMKTAVAEACLNAIEHGNRFAADIPVTVTMVARDGSYSFTVADRGTGASAVPPRAPRLIDKWRDDKPRGWGLYLMGKLADRLEFGRRDGMSYVEIIFDREGEKG